MSGNAPVYDLIDDLHYSYAPGANPVLNAFSSKLQGVDDVVTDAAAQPHGVFLPSSGYGYDDNGNMISAGSVSAEYNILNLPTVLSTSNGDRKFEYVFGGGKYSAELITGNQAIDEMRHYLGGMEFKDGVLEAYNFGDGRVVWENGVPRFQYRLADHLGNTVVFFEDKNNNGCITTEDQATSQADLEIIQRLLYYPFGMALEGLGAWSAQPWQQYRYNGKERDTLTGWYEYGFRWYIDGIGRFTGVDPIADQFAHVSVYNYAENEPVGHIDLWGLQKFDVTTNSPGPNGRRGTTVRLMDGDTSNGLQVTNYNYDQNGRRVRTSEPQDFFNNPKEEEYATTILNSYNRNKSNHTKGMFFDDPAPEPIAVMQKPSVSSKPQSATHQPRRHSLPPNPSPLSGQVFIKHTDIFKSGVADEFINSVVSTLKDNPALRITIFSESNMPQFKDGRFQMFGTEEHPPIINGLPYRPMTATIRQLVSARANRIQSRLIEAGISQNRINIELFFGTQSRVGVKYRR